MTIICAWCGDEMSESCPLCGCRKLMMISSMDNPRPDQFQCSKGHTFDEGEGGDSHGICNPCLEKRRQEVLEKTA